MLRVSQNHPWRTFENLIQNPFGVGRELERMFSAPRLHGSNSIVGWPQFNVWSNDEELIVTAEIPGLDAEQINVDVNNNQLTVSASVESSEVAENQQFQRRERFSGSFERTIKLPFAVDQEKSEARYRDGVLEIRLSKPERDKPRKLTVQAG